MDSLNFDILDFLEINNVPDQEKEELRTRLESQVKEYLLNKLIDQLPLDFEEKNKEQLKHLDSLQDLINLLKQNFPDLQEKVTNIIQDFKKEYRYA